MNLILDKGIYKYFVDWLEGWHPYKAFGGMLLKAMVQVSKRCRRTLASANGFKGIDVNASTEDLLQHINTLMYQ